MGKGDGSGEEGGQGRESIAFSTCLTVDSGATERATCWGSRQTSRMESGQRVVYPSNALLSLL